MSTTEKKIYATYFGDRSRLFRLTLVTSLLTLITVGVYRFWAKTRIRKYIWSSTRGDGAQFEYTGTGLEKFLGFLVAITILAVYLGIIQIVLFFYGLQLFVESEFSGQWLLQIGAFSITFLAVLPLIFFAQYRARRYKLARTRWRGVRFGMDQAGWSYAWRALMYTALAGVTLGVLLPLMSFRLEKFMTDRMWYGDAKFTQGGKWTKLYGAMVHMFIGVAIIIGSGIVMGVMQTDTMGVVFGFIGCIWFFVGTVVYRVRAFKYLMQNKVLGEDIIFYSKVQASEIITAAIIGTLVVGLIMGLGSLALWVILFALGAMGGGMIGGMIGGGIISISASGFIGVALYLGVLALSGALSMVWVTQPIIELYVESITVRDSGALDLIRQREADQGADAEGFADALDIGGAI